MFQTAGHKEREGSLWGLQRRGAGARRRQRRRRSAKFRDGDQRQKAERISSLAVWERQPTHTHTPTYPHARGKKYSQQTTFRLGFYLMPDAGNLRYLLDPSRQPPLIHLCPAVPATDRTWPASPAMLTTSVTEVPSHRHLGIRTVTFGCHSEKRARRGTRPHKVSQEHARPWLQKRAR